MGITKLNKQFLLDNFQVTDFNFRFGNIYCPISVHDQLIMWLQLNCPCTQDLLTGEGVKLCRSYTNNGLKNYKPHVFLCDKHLRFINNIWNIN